VVRFKLPKVPGGTAWECLIDTNQPELTHRPTFRFNVDYEVTGRSLLLFELQSDGKKRR
jgi:glycogen operon protein